MNWTRRYNLLAGLGLIVVVNAIALAGVAWNRSEPADSRLQLSERELGTSYEYQPEENSGIAWRLNYRWPTADVDDYRRMQQLTSSTMAELGFAVPTDLNEDSLRRYRHQLDREALLVLEFNGELYQQQLQRAQARLQKSNTDLAALPDNQALREAQKAAREDLQREQHSASRLLVIDSGLQLDALRASYPDRQRYAIVRSKISTWAWYDDKHWKLGGTAEIPVADNINLPQRWHALFAQLPLRAAVAEFPAAPKDKLFNAEVSFGQRLEPWISSMQAGKP
jgi:hypothetical protein